MITIVSTVLKVAAVEEKQLSLIFWISWLSTCCTHLDIYTVDRERWYGGEASQLELFASLLDTFAGIRLVLEALELFHLIVSYRIVSYRGNFGRPSFIASFRPFVLLHLRTEAEERGIRNGKIAERNNNRSREQGWKVRLAEVRGRGRGRSQSEPIIKNYRSPSRFLWRDLTLLFY